MIKMLLTTRIVAILAALIIFCQGDVPAADMPVYDRLNPLKDNLNAPTAVAIDNFGYAYVVESINNSLLIYTQSGAYNNSLSELHKPISLAVDSNGRIYVGNKATGNVEVYDSELKLQLKLGVGDGEFLLPGAVAIDNTGKIFVADSEEDVIKVYNSDGSKDFTFGRSGSGDGEFNFPTSIAIDETTEELIISDLQLTTDMYGGQIKGARIQIFDKTGAHKRSFGEYGVGDGKLGKPMGVAVDESSRIYVTDAVQHAVHVFNGNGTFIGAVYSSTNPIRTPLGIAIGSNNKLYISSLITGKVEVYGIALYTQMEVSPLSLTFEDQEGSPPTPKGIEIRNNGSATLNWTASTKDDWINLYDTSGSLNRAEGSKLYLGVNLEGLTSGTYTGHVTICSDKGTTEVVTVNLTVLPTPVLSVSPLSLEFTSTNGSIPFPQTLTINNAGAGTLNWNAVSDSDWITISKKSGTVPELIEVSVNIASKNIGNYTGTITVRGNNASLSPAVTLISLNLIETMGTINVTNNIEEATFIVNGPESFLGSGAGWGITNALTGTYSIIFGDVAGHTTPSSQVLTLKKNGVITFTGNYISNAQTSPTGSKNIIAGTGPGDQNTGLVKIFKSDGTETGVEFIAHQYKYGVNVATGDINADGVDEIITAPGPGPDNPSEIHIFNKNANELSNLSITANSYKYGATVASGDFDGDGYHEVVVGAGAGAENPAEVKVFTYDNTIDRLIDSGINLIAYGTGYGVIVATGDIDSDGEDELITAPGPGDSNDGTIRIWEVDASMGVGNWSVTMIKEISAVARYRYSVTIASGDINGDGYSDVITGAGPHSMASDQITTYDISGNMISEFTSYIADNYGAVVAVGDLNNDGVAEIIVGAGPGSNNDATIKTFDLNGIEQSCFKALMSTYGVNIAIGVMDLN